ncbi:MAG: matrixin family metalloprotease [Bacteroidota bacterium]
MKNSTLTALLFLGFHCAASIHPLSLESRITNSAGVALVTLNHQVSYWDQDHHNIYTLYVLDVEAYLKGSLRKNQIAVVAPGGTVGYEKQIVFPNFKLTTGKEYILLLGEEDTQHQNVLYQMTHFGMPQLQAYTGLQGVFTKQHGHYHDPSNGKVFSETDLAAYIQQLTRFQAVKPDGTHWRPRVTSAPLQISSRSITSVNNGAGNNPSSYVAGTIEDANDLIITGSGFGSTQGSVEFFNADDGGATFIEIATPSDYVSWTDTQIRLKIPSEVGANAGTGTIRVLDATNTLVGTTSITIDYSISAVYSDFSGFAAVTRQFPALADIDNNGGYTYSYNDAFITNTDATASFERAVDTWRCGTGVNFSVSSSATTAGIAGDGINVVTFSNSLSSGTLGIATIRFSAFSNGICTYWYAEEMDIAFNDGTNWNFDGGAPSFFEFDFESVALHEVGHTHGLNHIIDNSAVMHFSISNGTTKRTLNTPELNGGGYMLAGSITAPCVAGMGVPTQHIPVTTKTDGTGCVLPIELLSFEGFQQTNSNLLKWVTSSEYNNEQFILERSADGLHFQTITTIPSKGNSLTAQSYTFEDKQPLPGINYYQLTQKDFDGYQEKVGMVVLENKIAASKLTILQNPVANQRLRLRLQAVDQGLAHLHIFGSDGRLVTQQPLAVTEGLNQLDLPVHQLAQGHYYAQVTFRKQSFTQKFLILP